MANNLSVTEPVVDITVDDSQVSVNVCETIVDVVVSNTGPQGPRGTQVLSGTSDPSNVIGLIGDQYINISTGYIFGPKTESGWGTGFLLGNGLSISDVAMTFYQASPSSVWTITHTLGFTPNIIVVDLTGKVIEGDYQYSGNTIIATFSEAIAGAAYLS